MILRPVRPGVAVRAADLEAAGRVDVDLGLVGDEALRKHLVEHADDIVAQLLVLDRIGAFTPVVAEARRVLSRYHQSGGTDRLAILILKRDLALGVRLEEWRCPAVTVLRQPLQNTVRVEQGGGQQILGLVGGVAEHDALVASAFVLVAAFIDALRDVRRLAVEVVFEAGGLPMKAFLLVADLLDHVAHGLLDLVAHARGPAVGIRILFKIEGALAANLAAHDDALRGHQRLAGDARLRVLADEQVHHSIGNLVRDLVRVTFGHRLGGEDVVAAHR
jgi:hypothetical protein